MREDLGMSAGKLAAQACHASLMAYDKAEKEHVDVWKRAGVTKIVLAAHSQSELVELYKRGVAAYLPSAIVADEGRTEVDPGTITGIAIGPAPSAEIDKITGHLKLYGKETTKLRGLLPNGEGQGILQGQESKAPSEILTHRGGSGKE